MIRRYLKKKNVADPRVIFEVQFYGKQAVDSGGTRKEWIRLCYQKTLTLVMALKSTCLKITTILVKWSVLLSFKMAVACVHTRRNTAGHFYWRSGTVSLCQRAQMWYGYFRNSHVWKEMSHASLSFEAIQHYQFISSTCLVLCWNQTSKKDPICSFMKNLSIANLWNIRDVSSGRRVDTLGNILEFVTGASEEPPRGFAKTPQI